MNRKFLRNLVFVAIFVVVLVAAVAGIAFYVWDRNPIIAVAAGVIDFGIVLSGIRTVVDLAKLARELPKLELENEKLALETEKLKRENGEADERGRKLKLENEKLQLETGKLKRDNEETDDRGRKLKLENEKLRLEVEKLQKEGERATSRIVQAQPARFRLEIHKDTENFLSSDWESPSS